MPITRTDASFLPRAGRARSIALTDDDIAPALMFVGLAALACVTPVKNDTWWHLRSGQEMWQTGGLLTAETFSFTSFGNPLNNHWWLTQLAFFGAYSAAGAFGLTVLAGGFALAGAVLAWRLMRGSWEARLVLLAWLALVVTPGWGIRPQAVSLAFLAIMAHLIVRDRLGWLPVVCAIWANAHALVVLGVAMTAGIVVESLIWSRAHLRRSIATFGFCAAAPLLTPTGLEYWSQVAATVSTSRALQIEEYRMPFQVADLRFWGGVIVLVGLVGFRRRVLAALPRPERALILAAIILAAAGANAARNASMFAIVAAPAISWLLPAFALHGSGRSRPATRTGYALIGICIALAGTWVLTRWQSDETAREWRPLSAETIEAVRGCSGRLFNRFDDGGYLMWTLPERPVFVDSRIEAYPPDLLRQSRAADVFGAYEEPFRRYDIRCAVVGTDSPMAQRLRGDARFRLAHADAARSVFTRQ